MGYPLYTMLGLVGLAIAIIVGLPRLAKAVPASLTAILVCALHDQYTLS
jgi:SulP family sulfate permease